MRYLGLTKTLMTFIFLLFMAAGSTAAAQGEAGQSLQANSAAADASPEEFIENEAVADVVEETALRRSEIMQEAVDALSETKMALAALDEDRVDDALDALATVTGKLKLLVARDPSLSLAPTDVSYALHDVYSDRESIENAIDEAKHALDEGRIQIARSILGALASELVVSVSHLPLATYPDAIAAIVPLIDAGELEEAKSALQSALNTQVVREIVFPMPVVRAELYLSLAEELALKNERSEDESASLDEYLNDAKRHLEMSELLGYGDRDRYAKLYTQLDEIEARVAGGKSGHGLFDLLRKSMDEVSEEA